MKAKLTFRFVDSKTRVISLRAGAKGTGKELWSCSYWPDSDKSVEAMSDMLDAYCNRHNIDVVPTEDW